MALALAGADPTTASTPGFAPPADRAIVYQLTDERPAGATMRRFAARRQVTFHKTDTGYQADLVLLDAQADVGGDIGTMFLSAMRALSGRHVRFTLDRGGVVTEIADAEALWADICRAVAAMGTASRTAGAARHSNTQALARALAAMPPDRVRDMLASLIAPMIAERTQATDAEHIIALPAAAPDGSAVTLTGIRRVSTSAGLTSIDVTASGDVGGKLDASGPGAAFVTPGRPLRIVYASHATVDRVTGLVRDASEDRRLIGQDGGLPGQPTGQLIARTTIHQQ